MKKLFYSIKKVSVIVGLGLLAFSASCEKKSSNISHFRMTTPTEPPTLDPRMCKDTTSAAMIKIYCEGLMRVGQNGEPTFALADRIEASEDGKTYTCFLKEAVWSDGVAVTAQDFEATWKKILEPLFPTPTSRDFYVIKNAKAAKEGKVSVEEVGVKALDSRTLQIDLEHPVPYFLSLLASHSYIPVPRHFNPEKPINCGPFVLKEWKHFNQLVFERNPLYWDKEHVYLDKVTTFIIPDHTTSLQMFENGEIDWAGYPTSSLPTDSLQKLYAEKNIRSFPVHGVYYYIFNTEKPPFNNVNLRKAFAYAINRREITKNVVQGGQKPATGIIPPSMWPENPEYFQDADIADARKYFELAKKELGGIPEITLIYNTDEGHHKIAQAIQQQWFAAFGFRVKLENKEWKVFLDELIQRKFTLARLGIVADYNDPLTFLAPFRFKDDPMNEGGWDCPRFREVLDAADQTNDVALRNKLLKEAESILVADMPVMPIYFYNGLYLQKPNIKGVLLTNLSDMDLKSAQIEK